MGTTGERTGVAGDASDGTTSLASELAAEPYNIVAALGLLLTAYWLLFRNLPVELFTLGLVTLALTVANVVVALRYRG
ncbi:hypothetical protein [Halorussus pelagicus]|uniref:hypothetical protein n=1 Tax=Halorussus pelagicus TaxID=2505977 RepID=UPI001408A4CE|nr:hypothetical protein [Halorussus pelagicus]